MLSTSTDAREVITLGSSSVSLRGTYHRPQVLQSGYAAVRVRRGRIGVVFLNALSVPRSANGDSAVYWAEALALQGYPSFRLDLAGLGDSGGEVPTNLLDYINSGGYASTTAASLRELTERFKLQGVVLVGHCSGAVTALFTAAQCRECCGLILFDPYYHLPRTVRPEFRNKLSHWAAVSRVGRFARSAYLACRRAAQAFRGGALPDNANLPLLRRWQKLASAGMPILVLRSPSREDLGSAARVGFDYLAYGLKLAGPRHQVSVSILENTNHLFAGRYTRQIVLERMRAWLDGAFASVGKTQIRPSSQAEGGLDEIAVSA